MRARQARNRKQPERPGRVAPLFRDFVEGAWKEAHFEGYKPSTKKGVRSVLDRQLLPAFGSKPLDRIAPWPRSGDGSTASVGPPPATPITRSIFSRRSSTSRSPAVTSKPTRRGT